jgi:phosphoenolpyruvate carboxylase
MLKAADIVEEYLADKDISDQRVFLARSDTAMNYGLVSAALRTRSRSRGSTSCPRAPAYGSIRSSGWVRRRSAGGLSPHTAERVGREYPSVVTFSIQSAFKFDYPVDEVDPPANISRSVRSARRAPSMRRARDLAHRAQQRGVPGADRRACAAHQPDGQARTRARRARKLHVGLFGYARKLGG